MAKKKRKPKKFSVVKAVKENARERVGQPKPGRAIEDRPEENKRGQKHKETLEKLLISEGPQGL